MKKEEIDFVENRISVNFLPFFLLLLTIKKNQIIFEKLLLKRINYNIITDFLSKTFILDVKNLRISFF